MIVCLSAVATGTGLSWTAPVLPQLAYPNITNISNATTFNATTFNETTFDETTLNATTLNATTFNATDDQTFHVTKNEGMRLIDCFYLFFLKFITI